MQPSKPWTCAEGRVFHSVLRDKSRNNFLLYDDCGVKFFKSEETKTE